MKNYIIWCSVRHGINRAEKLVLKKGLKCSKTAILPNIGPKLGGEGSAEVQPKAQNTFFLSLPFSEVEMAVNLLIRPEV